MPNFTQVAHATQLNNTEWTPYFMIALLYLHVKAAGSVYTAYGSLLSCVAYTVVKLVFSGVPTPVIAGIRYSMLTALAYEVYQTGVE